MQKFKQFLHSKAVLVIFIVHCLVGLFELYLLIDSKINGSEVWAFFFMFTLDFPISILAFQIIGLLGNILNDIVGAIVTFGLMVVLGTLWWAFLYFLARKFFTKMRQWLKV